MSGSLDPRTPRPNAPLSVTAQLANPGPAIDGNLTLAIAENGTRLAEASLPGLEPDAQRTARVGPVSLDAGLHVLDVRLIGPDGTLADTANRVVTVSEAAPVRLELVPNATRIAPGQTETIAAEVTSHNATRTGSLAATGPESWTVDAASPARVDASETEAAAVDITAPDGAEPGTEHTVQVRFAIQDTALEAAARVTVAPESPVDLSLPDEPGLPEPGENTTYELVVENTADDLRNVTLGVRDEAPALDATLDPEPSSWQPAKPPACPSPSPPSRRSRIGATCTSPPIPERRPPPA
jgi:uncharacterized membrane protein